MLCILLYCFVVIFLGRSASSVGAGETNDNRVQRMKRLKKVNKMFGQAKILMSLVQIVASMPFVLTGVHFSPFFKSMANAFGVVTLDVLALTSPFGCEYSVRFFDRLIVHLLLPVACLLSIGLAVATVRACVSKSNAHETQMKINQAVSKIIVLIILLIFPGLSTRLFSVFKCQSFPGIEGSISLLVADYSVNCNEAEYHMFAAVATVFVFVYIAGIPLVMFLLLWTNKKHLHNVDSDKHLLVKNALGDLYMQYEPEYWWFELMVLLNKTIMCGGLVVLSPGSPSQVFCGVLFMMFQLLLVLKLSPFLHDSEDTSSIAASLGLTLIYIGALMQMLETTYEDMENKGIDKYDKENLSYVGAVLDVLPVFCVCTVIGIIVVMDCGVYDCCKKKKKKEQKERVERNQTRVNPTVAKGGPAQQPQQQQRSMLQKEIVALKWQKNIRQTLVKNSPKVKLGRVKSRRTRTVEEIERNHQSHRNTAVQNIKQQQVQRRNSLQLRVQARNQKKNAREIVVGSNNASRATVEMDELATVETVLTPKKAATTAAATSTTVSAPVTNVVTTKKNIEHFG